MNPTTMFFRQFLSSCLILCGVIVCPDSMLEKGNTAIRQEKNESPSIQQDQATRRSSNSDPQNWNQWRGPNRNGLVDADWPDKLDKGDLKKLWSHSHGPSYSGPIVHENRVFVTETRNRSEEVVTAYDAVTGRKLWETSWKGAMKVPFFAAKNGSWIRSTPATDGRRLFVAGIEGLMVCLDVQSGRKIWEVDLNMRYKTPRESFGHVCSPMIIDPQENAVYTQCSAGFIKMDSSNGSEIWRALPAKGGMMSGGAFSSPYPTKIAGKDQILVLDRKQLAGIDPKSGTSFWKREIPSYRGMHILTPVNSGNIVFTSPYSRNSFGVEVTADSTGFKTRQAWKLPSPAYMSSPIVVDGRAYVHLQNQQFACIDIQGGKMNWVSKERPRLGDYWSMISNRKKILALASDGNLHLIKVNPKRFEKLGKVKLDTSNSWAHLAVVGDKLFVRGLDSITAYQWPAR